jgi:branched-chain amino acid transport system ATP-binding protein
MIASGRSPALLPEPVRAEGTPVTAAATEPLLRVQGLTKRFGGVAAVGDVSFDLQAGRIVGLIGPNGAGKTTLVNLVTGVHPATSGRIRFDGQDVGGQRPYQAARRGLSRTFQIVQPFPHMTVLDNVAAGALYAGRAPNLAQARDEAMTHLRFVGLHALADEPASALTLPSRKRLELAKSLAMRPKLLLLDEVNAGLNSAEIGAAIDLIRQIAARGITVLLIEHLMKVVFSLCEELLVLHHGELIARGAPDAVAADAKVIEAYLGTKYAQRMAA